MLVLKCERRKGSLSSTKFSKFSKSKKPFGCNGKKLNASSINLPMTDNNVDNENHKIYERL